MFLKKCDEWMHTCMYRRCFIISQPQPLVTTYPAHTDYIILRLTPSTIKIYLMKNPGIHQLEWPLAVKKN